MTNHDKPKLKLPLLQLCLEVVEITSCRPRNPRLKKKLERDERRVLTSELQQYPQQERREMGTVTIQSSNNHD